MADNNFKTTITTDFQQLNVKALEDALGNIDSLVKSLPKDSASASASAKKLVDAVIQVNKGLRDGKTDSEEWLLAFKEIQNIIRTINLTKSSLKLFDDNEITKIRAVNQTLNQTARALRELDFAKAASSGALGVGASVKQLEQYERKLLDIRRVLSTPQAQKSGSDYMGLNLAQTDQSIKQVQELRKEQVQLGAVRKQEADAENRRQQVALAEINRIEAAQIKRDLRRERAASPVGQAEVADTAREQAQRRAQQEIQAQKDREAGLAVQELNKRELGQKRQQLRAGYEDSPEGQQAAQEDARRKVLRGLAARTRRAAAEEEVVDAQAELQIGVRRRRQIALDRARDEADSTPEAQELRRIRAEAQAQKKLQARAEADAAAEGTRAERIKAQRARRAADQAENARQAREDAATPAGQEAIRARNQDRIDANLQSRAQASVGSGAASILLVQSAVMANFAIIGAVVNSIKQALGFSIEFEAAMANVRAVTGVTNVEMMGLQKTVMDVATTTKFGTLEVAQAALTLGQAGLSIKQISDSLGAVVGLATASGTSIANAVDLVTSVVGVFDKNTSDVADIANKITQAANGSKVGVEQLALGLQYAGNTAAQMGVSFEEVTAAMAAMSNAGIKSGSTMGTGLRQFLVEVQKPSEDFMKILTRLGLSISDLDFKSKGFVGVLQTLRDAGFVASDAIASFDVRGAAAFNALLARPEDFQKQYDSLANSTAAMKANEVQMNTLSAQASRLGNTLGNVAVAGFDNTGKAATALTRILADIVTVIADSSTALQVLGIALTGLSVAGATFFLTQLALGLAKVVPMMYAAATGGTALTLSMGGLAIVSGAVGLAVAALAAAYTIYKANTKDAQTAVDEAEASMNKIKGTIQEKDEAILRLNNRLDILAARQNTIKDGSPEFNTQLAESREITSQWGIAVDATTSSMGGLVQQIKKVRQELMLMKNSDMNALLDEAQTKTQNAAAVKFNKDSALQNYVKASGKELAPDSEIMKALGPKAAQLQEMLATLRSGQNLQDPAQLSMLLRPLSGTLGARSNFVLRDLTAAAAGSAMSGKDLRASQAEEAKIAKENNTEKITQSVMAQLESQGVNTEVLRRGSSTIREDALNELRASGGKFTEVDAQNKAREKLQEANNKVDAALVLALDNARKLPGFDNVNPAEIAAGLKTMAAQAKATNQSSFIQGVAPAQARLKIEADRDSSDVELRKIRREITSGNGGDADRAREIIRAKGERDFAAKTLDKPFGEERDAARAAVDREVAEQIEDFDNQVRDVARRRSIQSLKVEGQGIQAKMDALTRGAKSDRAKATDNLTFDQINDLMDDGIAKLMEVRKLKLEKINLDQKAKGTQGLTRGEQLAFENEKNAAVDESNAAIDQYIASFKDVIGKSIKLVNDITNKVKEAENFVKQLSLDVNSKLYVSGAGIRANDVEAARNNGPLSGLRRTEVDKFNTSRSRETLDLAQTNYEIQLRKNQQAEITKRRDELEQQAQALRAQYDQDVVARNGVLNGRDPQDLSGESKGRYNGLSERMTQNRTAATNADTEIAKLTKDSNDLRDSIDKLNLTKIGLTMDPETPLTIDNLNASLGRTLDVYSQVVNRQDTFKTLEDGTLSALNGIQGGFADAAVSIVTHTNTIAGAFRSMAGNIIKAMLQVLSQALALNAVKGILGMFGGGLGGGAAGLGSAAAVNGSAGSGAVVSVAGNFLAAEGGLLTPKGFVRMAGGGDVVGGTSGKDSVPTMLMPGEFVLKKKAVDAVGKGFVRALNNQTASTVSQSSSSASNVTSSNSEGGGGVLNVWVVSPDQVPSMGPSDVLATMSQDMMNNGPFKKLVKQVALGTM